jgi:rare lipoprotein A
MLGPASATSAGQSRNGSIFLRILPADFRHLVALVTFIAAMTLGHCVLAAPSAEILATEIQAVRPEPHQTGLASWYGPAHNGQKAASGETFDPRQLTAAHRDLPFGAVVRVTDLGSGKSVVVRINDRGPFVRGRVIDLSEEAARRLGMLDRGVTSVTIEGEQICANTAP